MDFSKQKELPDRLPVAHSVSKERHAELSVNFNLHLNKFFYGIKPLIPRAAQLFIRRRIAKSKRSKFAHLWPIDLGAGVPPAGWRGWPNGKQFALVLSHDVDTRRGYENVLKLADLEEKAGFRSSFNFVPERYGQIALKLIEDLKQRGFEVGVHGLKHDGKLFQSRQIFEKRAPQINSYLDQWGTAGFTAPSMLQNLKWMHALNIDYSISTFDTDPFEPQPQGVGTIFPFWYANSLPNKGFVELPYTLPQDSTLFIIFKEKSISVWKKKLEWLADKGGMALLNSHPDYMCFEPGAISRNEYPAEFYAEFLDFVSSRYQNQFWRARPDQIAAFWREHYS
jgi:hypothetical protein